MANLEKLPSVGIRCDDLGAQATRTESIPPLLAFDNNVVPKDGITKKIRHRNRPRHKSRKTSDDGSSQPSSTSADALFSFNSLAKVNTSFSLLNLDTDADMDRQPFFGATKFFGSTTLGANNSNIETKPLPNTKIQKHLAGTSFGNDSPLVLAEEYQESIINQFNNTFFSTKSEAQVWQPADNFQSPQFSSRQKLPKVKKPRSRKKNLGTTQDSPSQQEAYLYPPITNSTAPASGTPKKQKKKQSRQSTPNAHSNNPEPFDDYMLEDEVKIGLGRQELHEGVMRINPKNYAEAYITAPDRGQDILIEGLKNRNRSLEGDEVVIRINPSSEWKGRDTNIQRTGVVVFLRKQVHPRKVVGFLKPMADRNPDVALFSPRDPRVPRIRVPITCCPAKFLEEHRKYATELFLVSIIEWTDVRFAVGVITESIGTVGDIKAENVAILLENDLRVEPYPDEMHAYFPQTPYLIPEAEILKREDLRKECIFTIDPATARDLDDAMSCKELPNGNLEIGVHISDVSFFVEEGTPFDKEVASRATSTYLVDTVYHMLPRELCMMCSLLPGEDKLAYSVFWEIDQSAAIVSHRFTRSVINSCAQLAYEHAQVMLESPDKKWKPDELPPIHGNFTVYDLSRVVNHLHRIANILRAKRFSDGALRIDQPKLVFSLDRETGVPLGYSVYVNKESHRLIEEFMLLANMTVARRIFEDFPRFAFLRSHMPPLPFLMEQLQKLMERYGVHLDISSAGTLQKTLRNYDGDDFLSEARMMVLHARCAKPMARAKYFCTNGVDEEDFHHYALNVPLYTHFTSPIRRYPDVMVHRLLSSSLGYQPPPSWVPDDVHKIAANCNKMKYAAKLAGEKSTDVYLALFIGQQGPALEPAVVVDVKDRSFDVIVCSLGINQRIYTNHLPASVNHKNQDNVSSLEVIWEPTLAAPYVTMQTIEMFSVVTILLTKAQNVLKLESSLVRPPMSGMSLL